MVGAVARKGSKGSMKKSVAAAVAVILLLGVTNFSGCGLFSGERAGEKPAAAANYTPLPENVVIKDLQGNDVRLEQYRGKVLVVNFWATWCGPCLIEMPWMIGFQEKYAGRGFALVGIAMDDEGKSVVEPWIKQRVFDVDGKKMQVNYPILIGSDEIAEKFGGLLGLPTTLIVNREGKIVKRIIGLASHDVIEKQIEALL